MEPPNRDAVERREQQATVSKATVGLVVLSVVLAATAIAARSGLFGAGATKDVVLTAALIAFEGIALGLIWFSSMALWQRALSGLFLSGASGWQSWGSRSPLPPHLVVHQVWIWLVAASMFVLLVRSGIRAFRDSRR